MPENLRVITDELLEVFLQCKYKARLRALGRTGLLRAVENGGGGRPKMVALGW